MRTALDHRFWYWHAVLPAAGLALIAVLFTVTDLDVALAHAWAYEAGSGWLGRRAWWAEELLHSGGRNLVRAVAAVGLVAALVAPKRSWQRRIGAYLFASITCSALLAGALKQLTNVDCPWDLQGFGGTRPYVHVFADRPDALPHAACFPGAHAASGFALFAFYFAWRDRSTRLARLGLAAGAAAGIAFSIAQQARGAHFLSHDLSSALLSWFACVLLYVTMLRPAAAAAGVRAAGSPASPVPGRAHEEVLS